MVKEKIFNKTNIDDVFKEISGDLQSKVQVVMIGGGAMSIRGEKEATKDIDLVVTSLDEFKLLQNVLENQGYNRIKEFHGFDIDPAYKKMDAIIFKDERKFWIDLFYERICSRFLLEDHLVQRSEPHLELENLTVRLMSREDIFLAKSITERVSDLDDMYVLYMGGLDESILISEMDFQTKQGLMIWEAFMVVKLEEMEDRFDITIPFKNKVLKIAESKMEHLVESSK